MRLGEGKSFIRISSYRILIIVQFDEAHSVIARYDTLHATREVNGGRHTGSNIVWSSSHLMGSGNTRRLSVELIGIHTLTL